MPPKGQPANENQAAAGQANMEQWRATTPTWREHIVKNGLHLNLSLVPPESDTGKVIEILRTALREFVGVEQATPVTELLIHRITYKSIRLSMYEASNIGNPEAHEVKHYISLSNSLRLDLAALAAMTGKNEDDLYHQWKEAHQAKQVNNS